jgi:uncharacterized cysteine cluster protein YcgN (CxxCxxCC family)
MSTPFWKNKQLTEMTPEEWELVCDGCGKCCLQQLQDEDTSTLVFTNVACDLLVDGSCRCEDYPNRSSRVPSCLTMTPQNIKQCVEFAPPSCAYSLLLQGKPLPDWHHLESGSRETVHQTGNSVRGRITHQRAVDSSKLEDYIIEWA